MGLSDDQLNGGHQHGGADEASPSPGRHTDRVLRQAVEDPAACDRSRVVGVATEIGHVARWLGFVVRRVRRHGELARREAVDFVAGQRLQAWDAGYRFPY